MWIKTKMEWMVDIYIFWGAWQDFRKRKIKNSYLWVGGISGVICKSILIMRGFSDLKGWLPALIPGVLFLLIAKVTKEKIGYGDGWVILILGNFLNVIEIWYVLQAAIFLVIIFSFILLCSKKVTREYEIPFLPFLWIAHIIMWGMHYA